MPRTSLKNVMRLIESASENKPSEKMFLDDLKRCIELADEKNSRKPSKSYKPSSMNCIRNMYYQAIGQEQDPSASSYTLVGICNSGTDIHVRVQTAVSQMKEFGMDCEYVDVAQFVRQRKLKDLKIVKQSGMETKLFHKKLNMSFMCDGIIKYKNHYYILELKTENSYKWQMRSGVDPKHYNQGTAYSVAFGLNEVIFVYINRDVLDMKSFMLTVTPEMKEELIGKIENCDEYVRTFTVPPKPENAGSKLCQYCSYRMSCDRES